MSALLEPTQAPPEAPESKSESEPPAPVERPCAACGAALAEGQDWCLECGAAQPGRLGGRPGWRAALTVVGATALLALGAGAAAYAALNSEAERKAAAPAPPAAAPTIAQPPAATAPATPPAEQPTGTVDPPKSEPADVPKPKTPEPSASTPAPSTPSTPVPTTPSDTADEAPAEPVPLELQPDFASVYDPFKRAGDKVGDPADAIDGKSTTAWEAPVGPDGHVRIGLVISLDKARRLADLEMTADTPGFTAEFYASKSSELPPDVLDARWKHVSDKKDVGVRTTTNLDGTYRHVLVWITDQPADTKVSIPEIELFTKED